MLRLSDIMHEDEVAAICRRDISEEGEDKLIFESLLSRAYVALWSYHGIPAYHPVLVVLTIVQRQKHDFFEFGACTNAPHQEELVVPEEEQELVDILTLLENNEIVEQILRLDLTEESEVVLPLLINLCYFILIYFINWVRVILQSLIRQSHPCVPEPVDFAKRNDYLVPRDWQRNRCLSYDLDVRLHWVGVQGEK